MKELKQYHHIPIYGHHFELVVCEDLMESRNSKKRIKYLGEHRDKWATALCSNSGSITEIFFRIDHVNHRDIAHEIFHAVGFIMNHVDCEHDFDNEEPFAYLTGYITELVYKDLKKWKIEIK